MEVGSVKQSCASNIVASIDRAKVHQIGEHRCGLFIVHWQFASGFRCIVAVPAHMVLSQFCNVAADL